MANNEKDIDEKSGPFPVLSVMDYGQGKIVFIGSVDHFSNSWLEDLDNKQLGLNIVDWLAIPTTGAAIKVQSVAVPATGTISVLSDPSGAAMYLDGRYEGTTPMPFVLGKFSESDILNESI